MAVPPRRPFTISAMWPLALLAVLVLIANLIIHLAAVLGFDPQDWVMPEWKLWVWLWGIFVAMGLIAYMRDTIAKRRARIAAVAYRRSGNPWWWKCVIFLGAVYVLWNVVVLGLWKGTVGELTNPKPGVYLCDPGHGRPVEAMSREEYDRDRRNEVQVATSVMLFFYLQIAFDWIRAAMGIDRSDGPGQERKKNGWTVYLLWWRGI